jgi:hypothetical protein
VTGDELRAAEAAVRELFAQVPDGSMAVPLLGSAPSRGSARACEG